MDSENYHLQARFARKRQSSLDGVSLDRLHGEISVRDAARLAERRRLREKSEVTPAPAAPVSEPMDLLIVSGLPRSGTSLMMQILAAAGIPPMTDGERSADTDNPEGYYEWEAVKSLPQNPALIEQAAGKATKVISALLPHLPPQHRYKIIFMTRPIHQIARSQQTMLQHRGEVAADTSRIEATLREHAEKILSRLRVLPNVHLLEVPFPDLVADPDRWLPQLAEFLPGSFTSGSAVAAVVRPDLFRNRQNPA